MKDNNPLNGLRIANNIGDNSNIQGNNKQNNQGLYNNQNIDEEIIGDN